MDDRATLISELVSKEALLHLILGKRKKKMMCRWALGIPFYYFLWHLSWVKVLFWIAVPMELGLLVFTLWSYRRLRLQIADLLVRLASLPTEPVCE
ncbi:MAG: hypothetical protein AAFV25_16060 [Bacteroidota bacterium]